MLNPMRYSNKSKKSHVPGVGVYSLSCKAVVVRPSRPSHPYNAGTEHVGFSPTWQTLRKVFGGFFFPTSSVSRRCIPPWKSLNPPAADRSYTVFVSFLLLYCRCHPTIRRVQESMSITHTHPHNQEEKPSASIYRRSSTYRHRFTSPYEIQQVNASSTHFSFNEAFHARYVRYGTSLWPVM